MSEPFRMTTDPIKALVDLGPALQRLMNAATATPWGNRGKLSDRIVGPDEKTIAEFVSQALGKTGDEQDEANAIFCTFIVNNTQTILAAIEALKPLADGTHVVVGSVFLNDLRAIADTGGRRIETAMDACDKIVELIDMEARLGPAASPAPSRFEIDGTSQDFYDCEGSDAPAALAAIKEGEPDAEKPRI